MKHNQPKNRHVKQSIRLLGFLSFLSFFSLKPKNRRSLRSLRGLTILRGLLKIRMPILPFYAKNAVFMFRCEWW